MKASFFRKYPQLPSINMFFLYHVFQTEISPIITFSTFFACVILGLWGRLRHPGTGSIIIGIIAAAAFFTMECIDLYIFQSYFLQNLGLGGILINTILLTVIIFAGSWVIQKVRIRSKTKAPRAQTTSTQAILSDQDRLTKLRKMLAVSARIRQDQMRDTLGLDAKQFNEKIWDWASEFGFKIDGDYINIGQGNVDGFIAELDKQFTNWHKQAEDKTTKV